MPCWRNIAHIVSCSLSRRRGSIKGGVGLGVAGLVGGIEAAAKLRTGHSSRCGIDENCAPRIATMGV